MKLPDYGEIYALITAVFWTIPAISFELAGKKVGSLSVNYIRLVVVLVKNPEGKNFKFSHSIKGIV